MAKSDILSNISRYEFLSRDISQVIAENAYLYSGQDSIQLAATTGVAYTLIINDTGKDILLHPVTAFVTNDLPGTKQIQFRFERFINPTVTDNGTLLELESLGSVGDTLTGQPKIYGNPTLAVDGEGSNRYTLRTETYGNQAVTEYEVGNHYVLKAGRTLLGKLSNLGDAVEVFTVGRYDYITGL